MDWSSKLLKILLYFLFSVAIITTILILVYSCVKSNVETTDFDCYIANININGGTIVVYVEEWKIENNNYVITGYDDVFRFKRTYIVSVENAVLISSVIED